MAKSRRLVWFTVVALHALFPLLWLLVLARDGPHPSDWAHLKRVADHFVAHDWSRLYSTGADALQPGYFWRYPPFALYAVAPLAWLPALGAYLALAAVEVVALAFSLRLLHRLAPPREAPLEWTLSIALSAPALSTVVIGQSSALIVLCVVAAAATWSANRPVQACALLGLLAFKPNWAAFFGLFLVARREWRGVLAMIGVAAGLCIAAAPLGKAVWSEFLRASLANEEILVQYDAHKLITMKGVLDATLGHGPLATSAWLATVIASIACAWVIWRRPASPLEHLGATLLLAVAANPYASFYDALVLLVPAWSWWTQRSRWSAVAWGGVGVLLALTWLWEHAV